MKTKIEIVIVMDKSGSMNTMKDEAISGFNEFLESQKKLSEKTRMTFVMFNSQIHKLLDGERLEYVKPLTSQTYNPGGMTALFDAMGETIAMVKQRRKRLKKEKREKTRVVFLVITDGYENSSRIYTASDLKKTINKLEEKHRWEFIYLGANQDAILTASTMGFSERRSADFMATKEGIGVMFKVMEKKFAERNRKPDTEIYFKNSERKELKKKSLS